MTANGKNDTKRFKLVVVGDGACGKTSLLTVFKVCSTVILQWHAIQTALLPVYDVKCGHFERAKMTLKMLLAS